MRTALLCLLAPLVAGCAAVSHTVGPRADFADLNDRVAGKTALVHLTDGAVYAGDAVRFAPDSTSWVDPDTGGLYAVPTWAVAEVERRDAGRTARRVVGRGVLIGAVAGAAVGALAGYDTGGFTAACFVSCTGDELSTGERLRGAAAFGAAGGMAGTLNGLLYGTLVGVASSPTERFIVNVPRPSLRPPAPVRAAAPLPGSTEAGPGPPASAAPWARAPGGGP